MNRVAIDHNVSQKQHQHGEYVNYENGKSMHEHDEGTVSDKRKRVEIMINHVVVS